MSFKPQSAGVNFGDLSGILAGKILTHEDAIDLSRPQAPRMYGTQRSVLRDQEIYGEGTKADCFFKVVSGVVRLCKFLNDGRRQVVSFHFAGDVFGVETGAIHKVSAEAVCDSTLVAYRRCSLESVVSGNEDIVRQMFFYAMHNAEQARDHTLLLGRCNAIERVAHFLRDQARHGDNNSEIVLEMSRIDIADYLGLTIETVSRTLSRLDRDHVIELVTSRIIRIKNFSALAAYAG